MRLPLSKEHNVQNGERVENINYKPKTKVLLNWLAAILAVVLILVIYLPAKIWEQEQQIIQKGHKRMKTLAQTQKFYHQMTGSYLDDPEALVNVVSAVRDSNLADSNFTGEQEVYLNDDTFQVDVPTKFYRTFDTTFAMSYRREETITDTICTVLKWNESLADYDTLYVNAENLNQMKYDSLINKETQTRETTNTYYIRHYLDEKYTYRPITKTKYDIKVDSNSYKIIDPIDYVYKEPRYLVFNLKDSTHGYIKDGEPSWK